MSTTTEWALLYELDGQRPCEFVEVGRIGASLWTCRGAVLTLGEYDIINDPSENQAREWFARIVDARREEGFSLSGSGSCDPRSFDFDALAEEVAAGARRAFSEVRDTHPDEHVDGYALRAHGLVTGRSAALLLGHNHDCSSSSAPAYSGGRQQGSRSRTVARYCDMSTNAIDRLFSEIAQAPDAAMTLLYGRLDELLAADSLAALVPHLIRMLERLPDADFGNPGPIAHLCERHIEDILPIYKAELVASVGRTPQYTTLAMLARLAHLSSDVRHEVVAALERVEKESPKWADFAIELLDDLREP